MSVTKSILLLALSAATFLPAVVAQGTSSINTSPSSTVSSQFPPSTDTENTGAIDGGAGASGGQDTGNEGPTVGAFSLGKGAIIGISVTAGVIVLGIILLWALWFTAKREQLTMKEQLKRASRRMTGRKVPPTPRQLQMQKQMTRRHATMYGGSSDLEKGTRSGKSETKAKPTIKTSEKDRSRSTSPEDDQKPIKSGMKFSRSNKQ